jgi:AraC-like DNA-binding protein
MFHPNMHAVIDGFTVTGSLKCRSWQGVVADVWEVDGHAGAGGEYLSAYPRLFVVLDESRAGSISIDAAPRHGKDATAARLSFIPAGLKTWSRVPEGARLRHLDLHLDVPALIDRFGGEFDSAQLAIPRLMFADDKLLSLAGLLAAECVTPTLHDLYGDSIALALFIELFQVARTERRTGQLSARRLRHVIDFIEANCLRNIRLEELAALVGLSQSYFSTAFKGSTGLAPHQWHTRARIERVKALLLAPRATLTEVAATAGFADQAHMTRVFKRQTGVTPAVWLRSQLPRP